MTKLNKGIMAYNKESRKKGKISVVLPNGDYKVEVIVKQDKDTGERTTKLEDWKESVTVKYRKKGEYKGKTSSNDVDTLYFAKVKPEAIIPTKRDEDGCYDIYILLDRDEVSIMPQQIVLFSTGIATAVSSKYRLDFKRERGSTGTIGLVPRSGQVDSGYRGEVFVPLQNTSDREIIISKKVKERELYADKVIYPASKAVCQMAVELVPKVKPKVITFEELQTIPSERGNGALGSSGK